MSQVVAVKATILPTTMSGSDEAIDRYFDSSFLDEACTFIVQSLTDECNKLLHGDLSSGKRECSVLNIQFSVTSTGGSLVNCRISQGTVIVDRLALMGEPRFGPRAVDAKRIAAHRAARR